MIRIFQDYLEIPLIDYFREKKEFEIRISKSFSFYFGKNIEKKVWKPQQKIKAANLKFPVIQMRFLFYILISNFQLLYMF